MCDSTQGSLCPTPMVIHQSMWIQWLVFKKLNHKVNDPKMTFDPTSVEVTCVTLPKDHCFQVPWEYINECGYSNQFCKISHTYIHTTYIHTYYVQNEWSHSLFLNKVQARRKVCSNLLSNYNRLLKWQNLQTLTFGLGCSSPLNPKENSSLTQLPRLFKTLYKLVGICYQGGTCAWRVYLCKPNIWKLQFFKKNFLFGQMPSSLTLHLVELKTHTSDAKSKYQFYTPQMSMLHSLKSMKQPQSNHYLLHHTFNLRYIEIKWMTFTLTMGYTVIRCWFMYGV